MNRAFNSIHGNGAKLNDEKMEDPIMTTVHAIKKMCPDIRSDVIHCFTKIKYHMRIRALNEQNTIDKKEENKRKALERHEKPKKIKSMRDFVKDGHFNK